MAEPTRYVSRAGLKLEHALREFGIDPARMVCADFGCNVGGFTDCLLQRGAAKVYAVDTSYGTLVWKLRQDPRVVVMERTNAMHLHIEGSDPFTFDLITIDLGWTPQRLAVPAALRWLKSAGRIITLIKPHYELSEEERKALLIDGSLADAEAQRIFERTISSLPALGVEVVKSTRSPIRGGKSSRGRSDTGNIEYLALLKRVA